MEGYWVWGGSPIRSEDGVYHLFASRWPKDLVFHPHWITNSEVVRATAPHPAGPYTFAEVVLPPRDKAAWDGRMTHNPTIHRYGDTYLLFYTGTTYTGPTPTPDCPVSHHTPQVKQAHANQRIGLATAPSPAGPWMRQNSPILEPRPEKWDSLITTNPAACVLPDGRVRLIYKSAAYRGDLLRLGVAEAPSWRGPYQRVQDEPILQFDQTGDHVEDPYLWLDANGRFQLIMKDMAGGLGGERRGGVHAVSNDGLTWILNNPAKAYSRTIRWDNDTTTTQAFLERPQLLIENSQPTHFFAATAMGGSEHHAITDSWTIAIPILDNRVI